jgi:hypothetical protein
MRLVHVKPRQASAPPRRLDVVVPRRCTIVERREGRRVHCGRRHLAPGYLKHGHEGPSAQPRALPLRATVCAPMLATRLHRRGVSARSTLPTTRSSTRICGVGRCCTVAHVARGALLEARAGRRSPAASDRLDARTRASRSGLCEGGGGGNARGAAAGTARQRDGRVARVSCMWCRACGVVCRLEAYHRAMVSSFDSRGARCARRAVSGERTLRHTQGTGEKPIFFWDTA